MKKEGLWGYFLVFGLIIVLVAYFVQKDPDRVSKNSLPDSLSIEAADTLPPEPKTMYGIVIDSLEVVEDVIRRNQFLGEILAAHHVTDREIHDLSLRSREVYDVRKIGARKKYTILRSTDSLQKAQYLVYEPNNFEYVVYKLKDSVEVYMGMKQIDTLEQRVSGIIHSSLWETMTESGADPMLIHKLAEVFAWQVDFYRIQRGDRFKVIYEELLVEGEPVGIGKIHGAYFNHFGEPYYGIYFDQGSGISYFDEKGESLQKEFLRAPLRYNRISSRYTRKRYHPVLKRYKAHLGTDYAAPTGTPIRTVGDGLVEEARYAKYNGRYIKIRHNSVYTTQYLHMSGFAKGIRTGAKVKQGQIIGYVGSTGLANGPHLCFRFWKNGQQVDALKIELPPSEPVADSLRVDYGRVKDRMIKKLEGIEYPPHTEETFATLKQY